MPTRVILDLYSDDELDVRIRHTTPSVIDTTAEALDDEPSGVRDALALTPRPLARCAPEPRLKAARRVRGHLRRVA